MASINVRPTNTDNKTTRVEVVRALARLENTALKDGRADEGNVTCTRNRRSYGWAINGNRYGWAINGNRCGKQDAANSIAARMEAGATLKAEPTPKAPRTEGSAKDGAATKQAHKPKGEPKPSRKTGGERLVEMLTLRDGGVTIGDIMAEFGIQARSARALISIEARKKRNLNVVLGRETGHYSVKG